MRIRRRLDREWTDDARCSPSRGSSPAKDHMQRKRRHMCAIGSVFINNTTLTPIPDLVKKKKKLNKLELSLTFNEIKRILKILCKDH